ncbi:hypothetical protein RN001_015031 [Aquatica leii]|uniref:Uncharacterized protein n=1 Tax=Aquatica leii TaxID=1421715 RepID=A0AAN7SBV2_9COLE|nr:hypothetical protein RN001_015031 [Aquatica leii]
MKSVFTFVVLLSECFASNHLVEMQQQQQCVGRSCNNIQLPVLKQIILNFDFNQMYTNYLRDVTHCICTKTNPCIGTLYNNCFKLPVGKKQSCVASDPVVMDFYISKVKVMDFNCVKKDYLIKYKKCICAGPVKPCPNSRHATCAKSVFGMSKRFPPGLMKLFTVEELEDLFGNEYVEFSQRPKANKGSSIYNGYASKLKASETTLHSKKVESVKINETKIKPSLSKSSRKNLFNTKPCTRPDSKPNVTRMVLKRKSTSPLHFSNKQLKQRFYTEPQKIIKTKDSDVTKISNTSIEEKEFIEIEKSFHVKEQQKERDLQAEIENILLDDNEKFDALKRNFDDFVIEHEKNMESIRRLLRKFSNADVYISTSKKTVAFAETVVSNVNIPDDRGLEKAVNMYNSIRKNYNKILATPQLDRTNLQTPKSSKKHEGLSRKLQKQCLLLLDTPAK